MSDAELKNILTPLLPEVQRMDDSAAVNVTNELLAKAQKLLMTKPQSTQFVNGPDEQQPT